MAAIPVFDHVVIVAMENHGFGQIIGAATGAPYINSLAAGGVLFTGYHAPGHPSFPNYFVLVSGLTWGSAQFQKGGDACPPTGFPFAGANIGSLLVAKGKTFKNYAENLPANHQAGDSAPYYGHHNPIPFFSNVAAGLTVDFTTFPTTPAGYAALPTVSLVIPNGNHDMHDGTVAQADTWLQANLDGYAQWAKTNNSLLIVWWDEDYGASDNPPEIFYGANLVPGRYAETLSHVNILRTLCDMYGLAPPGGAATATAITDIWSGSPPPPPPTALRIDTTSVAAVAAGSPFSVTVIAEGGTPPYAWTETGGLPATVTLTRAGVLSGTAPAAGSYPFTLGCADSAPGAQQQTATQRLTLTVTAGPPPPPNQLAITTTSLPPGLVGAAYRWQLAAQGGTPAWRWSATALPPGVACSATGLLSGLPASAGTYTPRFAVTDSGSPPQSASATLTLLIRSTGPPPPPPGVASGALPGGAGALYQLVPADAAGDTAVDIAGFIAPQDIVPGEATP